MTNADILLPRVRKEWRDKTLALVCCDALQEDADRTRSEALRIVARERLAGKNAYEVNIAAKMLGKDWCRRRKIVNSILRSLRIVADTHCIVFVCAGSKPPSIGIRVEDIEELEGPGIAISVGARWVIRCDEKLKFVMSREDQLRLREALR